MQRCEQIKITSRTILTRAEFGSKAADLQRKANPALHPRWRSTQHEAKAFFARNRRVRTWRVDCCLTRRDIVPIEEWSETVWRCKGMVA